MKSPVIFLLFALCYVECRKILPIDKNANLAFINMEGGGGAPNRPSVKPVAPAPSPVKPAAATAAPVKPAVTPAPTKASIPVTPQPMPKPVAAPAPLPAKPSPPAQPNQPSPNQIKPKPVNPAPVANPITTPGPGSVKQLVNFYDSQGKASPIRPYSYSQAVKQG